MFRICKRDWIGGFEMTNDKVKIIEAKIIHDYQSKPMYVQSRVIEVDSWEKYVEEIKQQKQINRKSIIGYSEGVSFPKSATTKSLKWDNKSLLCEFYLWNKTLVLQTAYVI